MNDLGKGDLIGTSHLQGGKGPIEIGHLGGHGRPDHGDTGTGTIVCVEYSGLASLIVLSICYHNLLWLQFHKGKADNPFA